VPVVVRSAPGRGSMFAVDLPLAHLTTGEHEPAQAEAALAGKLVVLVDDEPSILLAASFILEKAGCSVISACSGQEALDLLAASSRVPDAVICDYELNEGHKGPEVIQALREEFNCDIPAMLVTGDTGGGPLEGLARDMGLPLLYKPL